MIRHVALLRFKADSTAQQVDAFVHALRSIDTPGLLQLTLAADLGHIPGTMDYVLEADFEDAEAYRVWDEDSEHERIRRELARPLIETFARAQFQL